jgi:cytochrome c oxidase cbb3-type subunit 2
VNNSALLGTGVMLSVIFSMIGLVLIPDWQMQGIQPVEVETVQGLQMYPAELTEAQARGRRVYIDLGCLYCHSQQVRPPGFGNDQDRGWGQRRSVPRDYLRQRPPLMGSMRTGPDLSNIGRRQPSADWHHLHLYNPRITSEGSIMPPFRFLYDRYDPDEPVPEGRTTLELPPDEQGNPRGRIAPKQRAEDLVAYLKSLQQSHKLEEVR